MNSRSRPSSRAYPEAAALLLFTLLIASTCVNPDPNRLVVVGSNAHITAVVRAIGGNRVRIVTVCGPGMCPGHFDLRPSHVSAANRADLLINQGWETWFPELRQSVVNPEVRLVTAQTRGNWMLPEVHRRAVAELVQLLVEANSAGGDTFHQRAESYLRRVDSVARAVRERFAALDKPTVLAADQQAPFLSWLGFRVVGTYGRPEEFTARSLSALARVGIDSAVGIIVDNLQSGPDAGRELARALGARHLNLTNFPFEDDYVATLGASADSLARVIE